MVRQGYGKLSNGFHSNTKVKKLRRLCPSALGVYAVAISYCSDVLNDGVMSDTIPTDEELARGFATIPDFPGNE